ncbi:hypothetical protein ACQ7DA_10665 [Zafaria sp. J156]|uniref:hypothetical protein n=1 Tax=Zafaria sp. J156 TaxID=3116490 RepID=UPI002E797275|nr:hypothetical protein [Zafaria sp. J156]MEE1621640.1 hypothetical protein [Zafaria sp. J156]
MTLDEQDGVATAIAGLFGHDPTTCIRDIRQAPHSGYRAVHVWLRIPERIEVQVRTHLQGMWANMYESAADVLGREIRYGQLPSSEQSQSLVLRLHDLSETIQDIEARRNDVDLMRLRTAEIERSTGDETGEASTELGSRRLELEELHQATLAEEQRMLDLCRRLRDQFTEIREQRR